MISAHTSASAVPYVPALSNRTQLSSLKSGKISLHIPRHRHLAKITMATSFSIESTVRGHHVYKTEWNPIIGEELCCLAEEDNAFDRFAVAISKDGRIVGHVPLELARTFWYFLQKRHSSVTCRITDVRRRSEVEGKGLVVPCVYIFRGKTHHLEKLIAIFRAQVR